MVAGAARRRCAPRGGRGAPHAHGRDGGAGGPELTEPRKCYVCKAEYRRLHPFYDQLCRACGEENHARRVATADLRGRVALVTGARVKIGYQAALLLLRAGCRVVALTRFPRDAAARYAREPDFEAWRERLAIYGVDLRHTPSVELLCRRLDTTLPRLDLQLHNACQTVRRPPGFYAHLLSAEEGPLAEVPEPRRALVADYEALRAGLHDHGQAAGVARPALLSQSESDADLAPPREDGARALPARAARPGPAAGGSTDAQLVAARASPRSRRSSSSRCSS